jgi:hypothetical protein
MKVGRLEGLVRPVVCLLVNCFAVQAKPSEFSYESVINFDTKT